MNKHQPFAEEERQRILEMYAQGVKPNDIAAQLGRSHQGIYKVLNAAGVRLPRKRFSRLKEEERKVICKLAAEKKTITDIIKETGRDRTTIKTVLLEAGIEPYWQDKPGRPKKQDQEHVFVRRGQPVRSKYGGFTSNRTFAHYYITKGYQGRFYITCNGTSFFGIITDHGYTSKKEARATLEYMKALFEREGVKCIDDVQN